MECLKVLECFSDLEEIGVQSRETFLRYETQPFKMYNKESVLPQIETVTRNRDFFSALAQVDIKPLGMTLQKAYSPHQRRFHLLSEVMFMIGPRDYIVGFRVPELGAHHLHASTLREVVCVQTDNLVGRGSHTLLRAREKLDGIECIIFGVDYPNGSSQFFLWDDISVRRVEASEPVLLEKVEGEYYVLSDVSPQFSADIPWKRHPWSTLSRELLETAKEGIIVDVDLEQYKIPRVLTTTLRVNGTSLEDSNGKSHYQQEGLENGELYDVSLRGNVVKKRQDRVFPDSSYQIDVIARCAVSLAEVTSYLPVETRGKQVGDELLIAPVPRERGFAIYAQDRAIPLPHFSSVVSDKGRKSDFLSRFLQHLYTRDCPVPLYTIPHAYYKNYYFMKDGRISLLRYVPPCVWEDDILGLSNRPQMGYCGYLTPLERVPPHLKPYFLYRGQALVFFDPKKIKFKDS